MPILVGTEESSSSRSCLTAVLKPPRTAGLIGHLRQHGVAAEVDRRYGDPAEELAAAARSLSVDMLVIGLRRDASRPVPVVSDVSRRFLRTASLPVLCAN